MTQVCDGTFACEPRFCGSPTLRGEPGNEFASEFVPPRMEPQPAVVAFEGDLDIFRNGEIYAGLQRVAAAECAIVDLKGVRYFGACLLGAIAGLATERDAAGLRATIVVVPDERLRRLFEITGDDMMVEICTTIDEAVGLCAPSRT